MEKREGVEEHVGEDGEGEDGEGRGFEGEKDGEREEGERDESIPRRRRPPSLLDGVGWGENDRRTCCSFDEFGEGRPVVKESGFGEDVVGADEAEDERDGVEEEDGEELGVGRERKGLLSFLLPCCWFSSIRSFAFPDHATNGELVPEGSEGSSSVAGLVTEGEEDEDESEDEVERVGIASGCSAESGGRD